MSIGRIAPSWAAFQNENTLALANFNFDFSLYKVEAPKEFDGLGAALSLRRRDEAENGFQHRTARRLGALFEQILPDVPYLIQAYGKRASEVSASPEVNPKGSAKDGVFEQQVGADGTTIWAAATSGSAAIAAHLLACMLARIWPPEHSTSLWAEIISERQKEIEALGASQNLSTRCAAQQFISRQELAKWDASARAWLRSADQVMYRHQTQLLLIFKNVNLSVNSSMKTYDSVIEAWKLAMSSVNRLLKGESLLVQNGAVLLGVSAWHLYPNLVVLKEKSDPIFLKDALVPETSFLTIGIEDARTAQGGGVHWSLPLGHLRYYGDPVPSSASVNQAEGRILMCDFPFVFLGAISKGWGLSGEEAIAALKWFSELWAFFSRILSRLEKNIQFYEEMKQRWETAAREAQNHANEIIDNQQSMPEQTAELEPILALSSEVEPRGDGEADGKTSLESLTADTQQFVHHYDEFCTALENRHHLRRKVKALLHGDLNWLQVLARSAKKILESDGLEHDYRMSLFRLGHRNEALVTNSQHSKPLFGLILLEKILPLLRGEEQQVQMLRDVCTKLDVPSTSLVIRYQPFLTVNSKGEPSGQSYQRGLLKKANWFRTSMSIEYELTTAKPRTSAIKRHRDGSVVSGSGHTRWLNVVSSNGFSFEDLDRSQKALNASKAQLRRNKISNTNESSYLKPQLVRIIGSDLFHWDAPLYCFDGAENENEDENENENENEPNLSTFDLLLGDPQSAAVYLRRGGSYVNVQNPRNYRAHVISIDEVTKALANNVFGAAALLDYFDGCPELFSELAPYFRSMRAFASAIETYESFSNASIALKIATCPLHDAPWLPVFPNESDAEVHRGSYLGINLRPFSLNLAESFACIINFELGCQEVSPYGLNVVTAVSSGDSIFVAPHLLSDPVEGRLSNKIKRIVGNIGLPGIAMLMPPAVPIIRKPDLDRFHVIKHDLYDGQIVDQFEKTQLQLSFTEYERAIDFGVRGGRDNVLFFLEALVTVTDSGEKVADLDVIGALENEQLLHRCKCQCKVQTKSTETAPEQQWPKLISVDNWEEFLQRPDEASVVRAHKNWQARLAAACISVARGHPTYVLPETPCWKCVKRLGNVPPNSMFVF